MNNPVELLAQICRDTGVTLRAHFESLKSNSLIYLSCPEGHEFKITWARLKKSYRAKSACLGCMECRYLKLKPRKRADGTTAAEYFQYNCRKAGHVILGKLPNSRTEKVNVRCSAGHEFHTNAFYLERALLRNRNGCMECSRVPRNTKKPRDLSLPLGSNNLFN